MSWIPVPGYEGLYEINEMGQIFILKSKKLRKNKLWKNGYIGVNLYKNRKYKIHCLHRLLLQAFRPIPNDENLQAAHLNGIKTDNRLENLIWATTKENASHKKLHGTIGEGSKNAMSKLTDADILEIERLYNKGFSSTKIGHRLGISGSSVARIMRGERWRHLGIKPVVRGARWSAKLNEKQVLEIRRLSKSMSYQELTEKFGVTKPTICNIVKNKIWKDIKETK